MITVLGASGFIGSNLVNMLKNQNIDFISPQRNEDISKLNLGDIIFCIGMTADFRNKPFETVEAHVSKLSHVLRNCQFNSLTYLSSTRVYIKSKTEKRNLTENDDIVINANDPFDLFSASKITGELLALNSGRENIKIVRLSNVFGSDINSENFITSIVKEALSNKRVELFTTPDSVKDYISIEDVCQALIDLVKSDNRGIFNLSFGSNTTNEAILKEIGRLTNAEIIYSPKAKSIIFQEISNEKLKATINFNPTKNIIDALPEIIVEFKKKKEECYFL